MRTQPTHACLTAMQLVHLPCWNTRVAPPEAKACWGPVQPARIVPQAARHAAPARASWTLTSQPTSVRLEPRSHAMPRGAPTQSVTSARPTGLETRWERRRAALGRGSKAVCSRGHGTAHPGWCVAVHAGSKVWCWDSSSREAGATHPFATPACPLQCTTACAAGTYNLANTVREGVDAQRNPAAGPWAQAPQCREARVCSPLPGCARPHLSWCMLLRCRHACAGHHMLALHQPHRRECQQVRRRHWNSFVYRGRPDVLLQVPGRVQRYVWTWARCMQQGWPLECMPCTRPGQVQQPCKLFGVCLHAEKITCPRTPAGATCATQCGAGTFNAGGPTTVGAPHVHVHADQGRAGHRSGQGVG